MATKTWQMAGWRQQARKRKRNRPTSSANGLPSNGHEDVANSRLSPAGQNLACPSGLFADEVGHLTVVHLPAQPAGRSSFLWLARPGYLPTESAVCREAICQQRWPVALLLACPSGPFAGRAGHLTVVHLPTELAGRSLSLPSRSYPRLLLHSTRITAAYLQKRVDR